MVTNHGVHEWNVNAGLPDTGGQNVYVNYLSTTLDRLGFRVTIFNRGGYPHPVSGADRSGTAYRNSNERICYLTDSSPEFIRKEEMGGHVAELGRAMADMLEGEPSPLALISHYWDGAAVAEEARRRGAFDCPHIWIPHSLGALKKEGTDPAHWEELRLEERTVREQELISQVDYVAATSRAMRETLARSYGVSRPLFFPPCVDATRFDWETVHQDRRAIDLLADATGIPPEEIPGRRIITEVSRTDHSKRKDVLIEAFARIHREFPDTLLALTIDSGIGELSGKLISIIRDRGVSDAVAVLGSIWDYIPSLYGMSAVYCTPSMMEGFGMSIQEAAACGVPAVASRRVPFAVEYLLADQVESVDLEVPGSPGEYLQIGEGAVVVPPDSVDGVVEGLRYLLSDDPRRRRMGEQAYHITIPRFTWRSVTLRFLAQIGITPPAPADESDEAPHG